MKRVMNCGYSFAKLPAFRSGAGIFHQWRFGFVILLVMCATGYSQLEEAPLKAFFLEAAIRFITWPDDSTSVRQNRKNTQFTIGYYSGDRFIPYLKQSFSKKQVREKEVRFIQIEKLSTIDSCDMLFIPVGKKEGLAEIILQSKSKPILTVSDHPEFAVEGVILCVAAEKKKINCYINGAEAQKSHLSISHHLLQKSKVVNSGGKSP